jgi:hypothetical protein
MNLDRASFGNTVASWRQTARGMTSPETHAQSGSEATSDPRTYHLTIKGSPLAAPRVRRSEPLGHPEISRDGENPINRCAPRARVTRNGRGAGAMQTNVRTAPNASQHPLRDRGAGLGKRAVMLPRTWSRPFVCYHCVVAGSALAICVMCPDRELRSPSLKGNSTGSKMAVCAVLSREKIVQDCAASSTAPLRTAVLKRPGLVPLCVHSVSHVPMAPSAGRSAWFRQYLFTTDGSVGTASTTGGATSA